MLWGVISALSTSCSPSPGAPLELTTITGVWHGGDIGLVIIPDNTLSYQNTGPTKVTLDRATISGLTTTGFDAGYGPFTTHFVINALPSVVEGHTRMTVDGTVLTRQEPAPDLVTATAPTSLPPPGTQSSLVGHWRGDGMALDITADGVAEYDRQGIAHRKLNGVRVSNVTAASFDLGVMGVTTTFAVQAPPHIVDGTVQMTVDGVVLTLMSEQAATP